MSADKMSSIRTYAEAQKWTEILMLGWLVFVTASQPRAPGPPCGPGRAGSSWWRARYVYLPADVVREQAAKLLGVSTEEVQSGIYELCISSKTILERSSDETERLYLPLYRETESNVANLLSQLLVKEELDVGVEADTLIQKIQEPKLDIK